MTIKIPGVEFDFGGGRVYILPPLALGDLEVMQVAISALGEKGVPLDPDSTKTIIDATFSSLVRNYPQITRAEVGALLDVGNMFDAMGAVLDTSGLQRKAQADAKNLTAQSMEGSHPSTGRL